MSCIDKEGSLMLGVATWEIFTLNMEYVKDYLFLIDFEVRCKNSQLNVELRRSGSLQE